MQRLYRDHAAFFVFDFDYKFLHHMKKVTFGNKTKVTFLYMNCRISNVHKMLPFNTSLFMHARALSFDCINHFLFPDLPLHLIPIHVYTSKKSPF